MTTDIAKELASWKPTELLDNWHPLTKFREPLLDLEETDDEFVLTLDIPGVEKDDINIKAKHGGIEIEAERKEDVKEHRKGFYRRERSHMGYYRFCTLKDTANLDKAKAKFENGVLEVHIPKAPEKPSKRIEVR